MKIAEKVPLDGPPDLEGKLEGKFAIPLEEMVERLNLLLELEYTAWMTYTHYSQMLRGFYRETLADSFKEHAAEELEHANTLSKRIVALGGVTSTKTHPIPKATTTEEMINALIHQEQVALRLYRDTLRLVGNNEGLRQHIESIIEQEQEHADELWLLLPGGPSATMVAMASQMERVGQLISMNKESVPRLLEFIDAFDEALTASENSPKANVRGSPYLVRVINDFGPRVVFQVAKFEGTTEPTSQCTVTRNRKGSKTQWSCDCEGFTRWNHCKHLPMVQAWDKEGRKIHPAFDNAAVAFKRLLDSLKRETEDPLKQSRKTHPKREGVNPKIPVPHGVSRPKLNLPKRLKRT